MARYPKAKRNEWEQADNDDVFSTDSRDGNLFWPVQ